MPATTGGRPTSGSTRSGYSRKRTRRSAPASQGHPSQGAPTVGGGTKSKPTVYRSPTPAPQSRPAPKTQPGPISAKERRTKIDSPRGRKAVSRGRKAARVIRRRRAIRDLRQAARAIHADADHIEFKKKPKDTDTKILGVNIEAELEGRGVLPKVGKFVGDKLGPNAGKALRAGGLPITDKSAENAVKDVADLTANLPSGAYMTAAAVKEAALKGDNDRLDKLWKDYKKSSAIPALAKGDFKEAAKRANERPVSTALELSGGKAFVGRSAGRVMRSGAVGKRAKRAASTERSDQRLYPHGLGVGGPKVKRKYSKDVITKAGQVHAEKRARRRGEDPDVDAGRDFAGVHPPRDLHPAKRVRNETVGRPTKAGKRPQLLRRVDTRQFAGERVRKARIQQAVRDTSKVAPHESKTRYPLAARKGMVKREESPLVHLVAEGTVTSLKSARAELKARLRHLQRAQKKASKRHPEFERGNFAEAAQISELLRLDDAALNRVFKAAEVFRDAEGSRQSRLRDLGQHSPEEQSARWMPYLQSHHGLKGKELREVALKLEQGASHVKIGGAKTEGRYYHGTDKATAAAVTAKGHFGDRRRAVVWAGDEATARNYGDTTLTVKINPRRPLDVDDPEYVAITNGNHNGTQLEEIVRRAGYDALVSKRQGWAKVFDKSRVHVVKDERSKIIRRPKVEPAFVTQRPVRLTARGTAPEAYQPAMRGAGATPPQAGKRSGTAYELGAREVGAEALARQALTSEGRATAAETFQLFAEEFGIPAGKGGRMFADTHSEALLHGKRLVEDDVTGQLKPGHRALVPVNIDGLQRNYASKLKRIQENINPDRAETDVLAEAMTEALASESGKGRWVLMPEDVVQRLREHADVRTHDLSGLTNVFKDVVLTTSSPTTWLTGNISDLSFRTIMEGITPGDVARGRAIVRKAETKGLQGEQAAAATAGGGFFHASSASERFRPSRMGESTARTVAAAPWRAWKGGVYALEHFIEELPQYGSIGKSARRGEFNKVGKRQATDRGMTDALKRLLYMHDEQIDHFATQLATDRALEARIQGLTEDVIGRWGKVSPRMRKHLATAPFVQWLGAALRYTLVTLPVKHPIKTAIFAGIMEMTEEERGKLGLSYLIPQDKRVQDYQMGTLPMNVTKGKFGLEVSGFRTSNLTSFGTAGQFPQNLPGFMLPQLRGAFGALTGQSFTGEDMIYPDWWPDKSLRGLPLSAEDRRKVAIGSLLEVTVPFASAFRRAIQEKGNSSMPYSTILTPATRKKWDKEHKQWREGEGTLWGGIEEWINPIGTSKVLTHGSVRDIREGQAKGKVFNELREANDAEYRKDAGGGAKGREAIRIKRRLTAIRAKGQPGSTPEERRLQTRLFKMTGGKHGYEYKTEAGYFGDVKDTPAERGYFDDVKEEKSAAGFFDDVK